MKTDMKFDKDGLIEEPCLSCDKAYVDNLYYEWQCNEKKCVKDIREVERNDKRRSNRSATNH